MNLFKFGANLRLIPETSKLFLYFRILEDKITVLVLLGASLMTGVCHHLSLRRVLIDDRLLDTDDFSFDSRCRETKFLGRMQATFKNTLHSSLKWHKYL